MVLQKEQIITTALELLDRNGLHQLTIRRLAEALKVQPGALYWHFENKQALLNGMSEEILKDLGVNILDESMSQWDERLKSEMITLRKALLKYRDGAAVVIATRPSNIEAYNRLSTSLIESLVRAGFTREQAVVVGGTTLIYTIGLVLMERSPINSEGYREQGALSPDIHIFFQEGLQLFIDGAKQKVAH